MTGTTVTTTSSSSGAVVTETPVVDFYGNADFLDQAWSIISVLETNTDAPVTWTNTASGGSGSTTPTSRPSIPATTPSPTQSNTITSSSILSASTSVSPQPSTSSRSVTSATVTSLSASSTYSCAMTSLALTTTSGVTYSTGAPFCTCNDGSSGGIGSTIGADQFTTYICETGLSMPVATVTPTNVPGKGGLPGCAAIMSVPGTSAYCNCGGTPAPTLSPTSSGFMNCDYTIQPTSTYDPAVPPPTTSTAPSYPYATGDCKVHIWEGLGQEYTDPAVVINVNITDASGHQIGHNASALDWGETLGTDSELPWVLLVTPQTGLDDKRSNLYKRLNKRLGGPVTGIRPSFEQGPVDFAYGGQSWDTSSSQCTVGGWDNGDANDFFGTLIFGDDFVPNRQMDCKFTCP